MEVDDALEIAEETESDRSGFLAARSSNRTMAAGRLLMLSGTGARDRFQGRRGNGTLGHHELAATGGSCDPPVRRRSSCPSTRSAADTAAVVTRLDSPCCERHWQRSLPADRRSGGGAGQVRPTLRERGCVGVERPRARFRLDGTGQRVTAWPQSRGSPREATRRFGGAGQRPSSGSSVHSRSARHRGGRPATGSRRRRR